jgi:tetratricopeptide (TPR) repeat protein
MAEPSLKVDPREIGALVTLLDGDRLPEAEQRTRALLALHPGAGVLWKLLGVALVRQGKDAMAALRRAAELLPQDAEAHSNLGSALHDRGQWTEALESLRRALAIQPKDVRALIDAANAQRALGRIADAVTLYQEALRLEPRGLEALNNLGNALMELGEHERAVACYGFALQIKPDDAQVHCNLGNALRSLGRLEGAIASTRRATALDPNLGVAHHLLGAMLAGLGRRQEAAQSYRHALALDPGNAEILDELGSVLRDLGDRREALAMFSKAVELDPRRAQSHCNRGNVLFELRRIDEAAACFTRAIALKADHAAAHLSLGVARRQQHRAEEAENCCRAALAIDPGYAAALCLLGELRADRGQFGEAEQLFERATAIDPDFPSAFCSIAAHRKMRLEDTRWLDGAKALLAKPLSHAQQINLQYALGKYFDDVGGYDEAFGHFREANELSKRHAPSYDRRQLTERVEQIIGRFDAEFVRRCAAFGSDSELPVFIVGMPRSGTSLAEQILASHPAVFGAGELTFWNEAFGAYRKAGLDSQTGIQLIPEMARAYLGRLTALAGGAARVIDKMPVNFLYAGLIHAALPRARIIHMQRHPIDTCLSIYFQNFFNMGPYANDLGNLAYYYAQYRRVTEHWRAVLPADRLLEMPYEALIDDQEGWSRRMVEFVGLDWDPKCLDFHATERVVITASKWQVRQKIHGASAGRWKHYEKHVGPLLGLINA